MADYVYLTTPVGRLVQGHPMEMQTKGHNGRPLVTKDGQPAVKYFFAIAIAKTDPGLQPLITQIEQKAASDFPAGQSKLPTFSWKIEDGDNPKHKGKEGFAGCKVLRCSSGFPIKCFTKGGEAVITEKDQIKRGYYIRASISFVGNMDRDKPGMYLNSNAVELFGYGEEIQVGPTGACFGEVPTTTPQGVSTAPTTTAPGLSSTPPPPGQVPPPSTNSPVMTPLANGVTYEAYIAGGWTDEMLLKHGYMELPAETTPASLPEAPPAPPAPPAPESFLKPKVMTPLAKGITYDAYIASGWTDEMLIKHGYMSDDVPY